MLAKPPSAEAVRNWHKGAPGSRIESASVGSRTPPYDHAGCLNQLVPGTRHGPGIDLRPLEQFAVPPENRYVEQERPAVHTTVECRFAPNRQWHVIGNSPRAPSYRD